MVAVAAVPGLGIVRVLVVAVLVVTILCTDLIESGPQFGARRGEVLKQVGLMCKLDEKGLVGRSAGWRGHHLVKERFAGEALVVERAADRAAGVDEKPEGQRQIVVLIEIADGLRLAVDAEGEVVFGQVLDNGAVFVTDEHRQIDELRVDGDGGCRLRRRLGRSCGLLGVQGSDGRAEGCDRGCGTKVHGG